MYFLSVSGLSNTTTWLSLSTSSDGLYIGPDVAGNANLAHPLFSEIRNQPFLNHAFTVKSEVSGPKLLRAKTHTHTHANR